MNTKELDLSSFSQDEFKNIAAQVIRQIKEPEKGIGTELFEAVITIVPQPCVEALVVDSLENPSKILLIWREDKHYRGWHFPGSFIRLGESFQNALDRVISRELGVGIKRFKNTEVNYSCLDSRGHTVGNVFLVELNNAPTKSYQWFNNAPEDLLEHHKRFLKEALGWE